jgi:hypothetical protein
MNTPLPKPNLNLVRDVFLFSAFTGIAFSDIRNLTQKNLLKAEDGIWWIHSARRKTGTPFHIPLLDLPLELIDKYRGIAPNGRLFPMLSCSKTNINLKKIASICGIERRVTFHQARHTYASVITLSQGVPLDTVRELMGHRDWRATQIYAHLTNDKVSEDMGLCPLMGRISINTEVAQFSTKMEVRPDLWDAKAYRLTGKSRTAKETNAKIDKIEEDIRRYYKEILDEQGYITAELVKNAVNGIGQHKRKLLELYREYMEDFAKRVGINRAPSTLRSHKTSYCNLQNFIREHYGIEDIPFKQLDYAFIEKYDNYLRVEKEFSGMTIENHIIMLKTMTRTAMAQGTIQYK